MAITVAQVKSQRAQQARRVAAAARTLDSKVELLQRALTSMTRKRKMIEAGDIPRLSTLYRDMVSSTNNVEKEIVNLGKMTGQ
ncbi:MAG: hypothetical protein MUO97_03775 [Dehalococcoidia bacterium]|nr:hypothetical protein [Dehalococcoidia bacterium]